MKGFPVEILNRIQTKDGADEFATKMLELVTESFAEEGDVTPGSMILHTVDPTTGEELDHIKLALLLPGMEDEDTIRSPRHDANVRRFIRQAKAIGVFQVQMMLMMPDESESLTADPNVNDLIDLAEGSQMVCVFVYFEHLRTGVRMWTSQVMEPDSDKPSLTTFEPITADPRAFPKYLTFYD